jgi:hypothetical protein
MQISAIFLSLGESAFSQMLRGISIGKLKTFQLYDRMKVRLHLPKLNSESIRKAEPKLWARLADGDEEFATELSQAILVSHLNMIKAVLDELGIPNEDGFFAKDIEASKYLTEGWEQRIFEKFKASYPQAVLLFYLNHLGWELNQSEKVFQAQS